jgi:hypothetical protein
MRTVKEFLQDGLKHYEDHAQWERKCAERCTEGSDRQQEILRAARFNEGRAAAYKEILDFIG